MDHRNVHPSFFTSKANLLRITIAIAFAALIVFPLLTVSYASLSHKLFSDNLISAAAGTSEGQKAAAIKAISLPKTGMPFTALFPQGPFIPESIATFESDCTTPKETFAVGDTVCAKAVGTELRPGRIYWVNSQGAAVEIDSFVPASPTATWIVSSTGSWKVYLSDFESLRAQAPFQTSDPLLLAVDLSVSNNITHRTEFAAGGTVEYEVKVLNNGPDAAADVELTQSLPNNATLLSSSQDSGPAFTCTDSALSTTCTLSSLASGGTANFTFLYQLTSGTPVGTVISNTATLTSTTSELHQPNNTSTAQAQIVAGAAPASCTLDCPNDLTVAANTTQGGVDGANVTFANAEGFGDCDAITADRPSPSFFPVGTTTVQITSASGGGSCSFSVTVLASAPPSITCPADQTVSAPLNANEATVDPGNPTTNPTTDVSVSGVRSDSEALDAPYPVGTTFITWTATNTDGLSSNCTQKIVVTSNSCAGDTEDPTITAPIDVTVTTPPDTVDSCGYVVGEGLLGEPEAQDNCSVTVTRSAIPAGNFFPVGTTTITYTATDGAGRTATDTQTVTVIDGSDPRIEAPADANYVCPSDVPAASPSQATRGVVLDGNGNPLPPGPPFDNCGVPTVTVTQSDNGGAGSASSPLVITRVFTATDAAGNSASDSQTITVSDGIAPTIALNGSNPQVVECHTPYTELGATASDNCGPDFAATPSGTVNTDVVGTYTITYNASDAAGNAATPVTRTVTVVDTTAPVITINGSSTVTVECHTSYSDAGATAADSCDTSVSVTTTGSVDVNTVGTYTVTYNASDDSGNAATPVTRTVNVVDTTAPTITLNSYSPSMWPPNHKYKTFQLTDFVTGAGDSCSTGLGLSNVVIEKVTSDEDDNSGGDGNTVNDIVIAADCKSMQLRSERNGGGNGRVYTITFKVTDGSGNVGRASARVKVPHNNGATAIDSGVHNTVNGSCP